MKQMPIALILLASIGLAEDAAPNPEVTASVYIYRLRIFQASKRRMTLALDNQPLAYLQNGRYYTVMVPGGKHILADKKPSDNIEFTVEPGHTYYLRAEFAEAGVFGFNTRFSISNDATGQSDLRRLKVGDPDQVLNKKSIPSPAY